MKTTTRIALQDLVDQAARLEEFGFHDHLRETGLGFRFTKTENGIWEAEFDLPSDEKRDATLLTLRMFDQRSESFSFHRLSKLADDPQLSEGLRNELRAAEHSYLSYLAGQPANIEADFFERDTSPSRGEIMRTVIGGGLAHRRGPARTRYDRWTRDPIRKSVLHQVFARTIAHLIPSIRHLAGLASAELALPRQNPPAA